MFVLLVCMSSAYAADTSNSTNTTSNDTYDQILNDSAISTSLNNVKFDPDQVRSSVKFDPEQVKNTIPMKNTGVPILPTLANIISLIGGFMINRLRS